ncbi:MAG: hypothetical protein ACLPOO_19450 [Terriglobales bacterium]
MTSPSNDLATEWKDALQLYPLYAALAREFVIELPACNDLEAGQNTPPQESVEQARQWFLDMDQRIQVYQLRQFLQTSSLADEEALRHLLLHHLRKPQHSDSDRDKVDFLLVQYFSLAAPSRLEDGDVDVQYVAQTLEPVLGTADVTIPDWLSPLADLMTEANACKSLSELLSSKVLEKSRKLKTSSEENYYTPAAMVSFTRFSFLMRRVFFRLMHGDLNAISDGLRELESRGVDMLDCRRAQFSAEEPIARLRMICQSWKVMFHAEYSSGQPLRMLVDLRNVIDHALEKNQKGSAQPAATRAKAAAAGAQSPAASSDAPEFEVSHHTADWGEAGPGSSDDSSS